MERNSFHAAARPLVRSLRPIAAGVVSSVAAGCLAFALLLINATFSHYARVEEADSDYSRRDLKIATLALLAKWAVAPMLVSLAAARIAHANRWLVCAITLLLLLAPAVYGVRVLSHTNACDIGVSYPLDGYYVFEGHECGR